ncbi:nucleoside triphosphate pyrophosphohydrolase [Leptolyngbya cf. ectocarpi LEGE 11479]|uniref:Nucleoside triphosphate pyrophosphohydrolase n=1 Tax=Leptolyngbya cf. ectocarpi LEGE 11479 TaxID=1828722 RepID=A0A929F6B7_LEPEC|nr:nucleoside triphosphate pyrophosphohydrolase [Leptolyngbya ectocarpi]MBE9067566.1 nucleoside triphosphate pyrophosphohydrolase [Leptolyngbya cf. ectocarpi LEGE 11479]
MAVNLQSKTLDALQHLIAVVAQLRNPEGGCPWDLAQTPDSLTAYVLEEAYEVVDAIQQGDRDHIAEELGDLLLQVVLQAQIFSETDAFDLGDVAQGITEKLIRRHPHVFGDRRLATPEEVHASWEAIKATEKGEPDTTLTAKLARYGRTMPPMMATMKISKKAAKAGFEWETLDGVWEKVEEELGEFRHALAHESAENQVAEFGDVLFSLMQVARWCDIDPMAALQGTNRRFVQRFGLLEQAADKPIEDHSIEELEMLWQRAKRMIAKKSEVSSEVSEAAESPQ